MGTAILIYMFQIGLTNWELKQGKSWLLFISSLILSFYGSDIQIFLY